MKQLLLIPLFFHMSSGSWLKKSLYPTVDLMTVRLEPWPINLQRLIYLTDTCYAVQFRDQSTMNSVAIKTLGLETIEQLKYFREGLITLKKGANGDVAVYKNYSIKKVGTKKENSWYILSYGRAVTNFQEPQVNRMIFIIDNFISSQYY
jgi:hypothetical protein